MSIGTARDRIQKFLADMVAAHAAAQQCERDLLARHRDELAEVRRKIDVAVGKLEALRWSLVQLDAAIDTGAAQGEPQRRRRGRSLSSEWNGWLSHLPVAPAPGMNVGPFIEIIHRDRPDMPRGNIRSQLSNLKTKGWVELEGTGWRLTKPLAALVSAAHENEDAAETVSSDAEAPDGSDPAGASDSNPPLLSFPARTAA